MGAHNAYKRVNWVYLPDKKDEYLGHQMKYRLKQGTAKKLREQYYLIILFWSVIWGLMAVLFYADENPQTFLIYLGLSIVALPYLWLKKIKPYFEALSSNVEDVYLEFKNDLIVFNHFENFKKFSQQRIEFKVTDIVHVKKAFRKDDSANKITLTLNDKTKLQLEDFENMDELLETIFSKSETLSAHL